MEQRLATGGQLITSPARFLWKDQIEEMDYTTITSFTTAAKKEALIKDVESTSLEEVPMIRFVPVDMNLKLANWIDDTLN